MINKRRNKRLWKAKLLKTCGADLITLTTRMKRYCKIQTQIFD
jgi:hypothetical protein